MPISNQQDTMDAEIKNLRIDRSAKQKNKSGRGFWRWILFSLGVSFLVGAALFVYARLNTAVEVETVACARRFDRVNGRRRDDPQRHRLHRRGAQDRAGLQSLRPRRLDRRREGRQSETGPGAGQAGG